MKRSSNGRKALPGLVPLVAIGILVASCGAPGNPSPPPPPPPPPPPGTERILMVGGIYSSYNDLAGTVAELAFQAGALRPIVSTITVNGISLAEHLERPATQAALANPLITRLVMQQGPTESTAERDELIESAGEMAALVADREIRAGLYVVWPHYSADIDATIANYTAAANAHSLALYPVGQAFRIMTEQHPDVVLYETDLIKPNRIGTYLAAMVITAVIFDQDPLQYPNLFPAFITPEEFQVLKAAARSAVDNFGRE